MITALRSLARDGWVLGIAAAAALAYATIRLTEATIGFALQFVEGIPVYEDETGIRFPDPPFTFVFDGRYVFYGDVVQAAALFVVALVVVAAVVHATRPTDET